MPNLRSTLSNCRKTARTVSEIAIENPTGPLPNAGQKHYYMSKQVQLRTDHPPKKKKLSIECISQGS